MKRTGHKFILIDIRNNKTIRVKYNQRLYSYFNDVGFVFIFFLVIIIIFFTKNDLLDSPFLFTSDRAKYNNHSKTNSVLRVLDIVTLIDFFTLIVVIILNDQFV